MRWIGLTGGIGTGKSTVAELIRELGYNVLNADKHAHQALQKNSPVFSKITQVFGPTILSESGEIDRKKLGTIVFADKFLLKKLEDITHPFIQLLTNQEKEKLKKANVGMAFYDIPLLFEKKLQKNFDKILVIFCKKDLQLQRAMARTGLSEEDIKKRLAVQIPLESKIKSSHYSIRNDGSIEELKMKVQDTILQIKKDLKLV